MPIEPIPEIIYSVLLTLLADTLETKGYMMLLKTCKRYKEVLGPEVEKRRDPLLAFQKLLPVLRKFSTVRTDDATMYVGEIAGRYRGTRATRNVDAKILEGTKEIRFFVVDNVMRGAVSSSIWSYHYFLKVLLNGEMCLDKKGGGGCTTYFSSNLCTFYKNIDSFEKLWNLVDSPVMLAFDEMSDASV